MSFVDTFLIYCTVIKVILCLAMTLKGKRVDDFKYQGLQIDFYKT